MSVGDAPPRSDDEDDLSRRSVRYFSMTQQPRLILASVVGGAIAVLGIAFPIVQVANGTWTISVSASEPIFVHR
ncbi:MAG TPA: hypothetical protein VHT05_04410 [Candidatus Elarobacter sp.]|nr:hypothetical protein [Candidatus Elarobacter sp.]